MFHSHSAKFGVGNGGVDVGAAVGQFICVIYNICMCVLLHTQDASDVACKFQSGIVLNSQTREIRIHLAQFGIMGHTCTQV